MLDSIFTRRKYNKNMCNLKIEICISKRIDNEKNEKYRKLQVVSETVIVLSLEKDIAFTKKRFVIEIIKYFEVILFSHNMIIISRMEINISIYR